MTTTMHTFKEARTHEADEALKKVAALLSGSDQTLILSDKQGGKVVLPSEAIEAFSQVIDALRARKPTVFYPKQALLTTQQAADYLGVSRPYLIQLLDDGKIPYSMVGTHRKILYEDLADYRAEMKRVQHAAIAEIIRISEEAGLYELE
jgi:excisionase family DNA binding protein